MNSNCDACQNAGLEDNLRLDGFPADELQYSWDLSSLPWGGLLPRGFDRTTFINPVFEQGEDGWTGQE